LSCAAHFLAPILLIHGVFATTDNHNAVIASASGKSLMHEGFALAPVMPNHQLFWHYSFT
jgi:hypothetical protein